MPIFYVGIKTNKDTTFLAKGTYFINKKKIPAQTLQAIVRG